MREGERPYHGNNIQSHHATQVVKNPKILSGAAGDPGRRAESWCEEIWIAQKFLRDRRASGLLKPLSMPKAQEALPVCPIPITGVRTGFAFAARSV